MPVGQPRDLLKPEHAFIKSFRRIKIVGVERGFENAFDHCEAVCYNNNVRLTLSDCEDTHADVAFCRHRRCLRYLVARRGFVVGFPSLAEAKEINFTGAARQ